MKGSSLVEVLISLLIFQTTILGAGFMAVKSLKSTHSSLVLTQRLLTPTG